MAWNKPSGAPKPVQKKPNAMRGIVAGAVVVIAAVLFFAFFMGKGEKRVENVKKERGRIKAVTPAKGEVPAASKPASKDVTREKRIRAELEEKVKEFVKKPMTNVVEILGMKPLSPDDPDNIMRTQAARDIGTILSFQPGEPIPPFVTLGFMFSGEDAEGAEKGDGGNAAFLDSLKKWKVEIKESDGEHVAKAKQDIFDSQLELIKGIEDGLTVNDSIKAAYEYRVRAAEYRTELLNMIKELHAEDGDPKAAQAMVKKANEKLTEQGLMVICDEEVLTEDDWAKIDNEQPADPQAEAGGEQQTEGESK